MDLHHEPSPSHGEMQNSYTLRAWEIANDEFRVSNVRNLAFSHSPLEIRYSKFKSGVPGRTRTG